MRRKEKKLTKRRLNLIEEKFRKINSRMMSLNFYIQIYYLLRLKLFLLKKILRSKIMILKGLINFYIMTQMTQRQFQKNQIQQFRVT